MSDDLKRAIAGSGHISTPMSDERLAAIVSQIRETDLYRKFQDRASKDTPDHRPDDDDIEFFDALRDLTRSILGDEFDEFIFFQILTDVRRGIRRGFV